MKSLSAFLFFVLLHVYAHSAASDSWTHFNGESLKSEQPISIARADEKHKGLVVLFMSVKCPCSNSHVPVLKELAQKHKDFRFLMVHSNLEESKSESLTYFKNFPASIEILQDEKTKIADLLKAYKTPHAFVFNPNGEIVYRGGVTNSSNAASADRNYLAEVLEDLDAGKSPRIREGRTLGCVIAREGEKNVF